MTFEDSANSQLVVLGPGALHSWDSLMKGVPLISGKHQFTMSGWLWMMTFFLDCGFGEDFPSTIIVRKNDLVEVCDFWGPEVWTPGIPLWIRDCWFFQGCPDLNPKPPGPELAIFSHFLSYEFWNCHGSEHVQLVDITLLTAWCWETLNLRTEDEGITTAIHTSSKSKKNKNERFTASDNLSSSLCESPCGLGFRNQPTCTSSSWCVFSASQRFHLMLPCGKSKSPQCCDMALALLKEPNQKTLLVYLGMKQWFYPYDLKFQSISNPAKLFCATARSRWLGRFRPLHFLWCTSARC